MNAWTDLEHRQDTATTWTFTRAFVLLVATLIAASPGPLHGSNRMTAPTDRRRIAAALLGGGNIHNNKSLATRREAARSWAWTPSFTSSLLTGSRFRRCTHTASLRRAHSESLAPATRTRPFTNDRQSPGYRHPIPASHPGPRHHHPHHRQGRHGVVCGPRIHRHAGPAAAGSQPRRTMRSRGHEKQCACSFPIAQEAGCGLATARAFWDAHRLALGRRPATRRRGGAPAD